MILLSSFLIREEFLNILFLVVFFYIKDFLNYSLGYSSNILGDKNSGFYTINIFSAYVAKHI